MRGGTDGAGLGKAFRGIAKGAPRAARVRCVVTALALLTAIEASAVETNLLIPVGERFTYKIYWGILPVGDAELWTEWVKEGGNRLVAIRMRAETGPIVSHLFAVDDFVESIVDPETYLPVRFRQKLKEGKRNSDETAFFDRKTCVVSWTSHYDNVSVRVAITNDTRDILSFAYAMRFQGIGPGESTNYKVIADQKLYELEVRGIEWDKTYLSHYGDVECLKVQPKAVFGSVFSRKGTVFMWFSSDRRRLCAKAVGEVPLASVKVILQSVEGPGEDCWTRKKKKKKK